MNQIEIWKDVKGYEGLYQVSSIGRVRSLDRVSNNQYGNFNLKGVLLSAATDNRGYYQVSLSKNNKSESMHVHRLVAIAFVLNTENKPEVNHKNGIKKDNYYLNFEWVTTKENVNHAFNTGLHKGSMFGKFGSDNPKSFAVIQLDKNGNFMFEYGGIKEAARNTGAHHSSIIKVCKGKQHTCIGFKWMYKSDYDVNTTRNRSV